MSEKAHWENVYSTKKSDEVSWFQPQAVRSLALIQSLCTTNAAHILDVGAGASRLVDDLLALGYPNLKVLDISSAALDVTKSRLGDRANAVEWMVGDVTALDATRHSIDLWHDRAVFHFLNDKAQRARYVQAVLNAVKPGGHVIVSTFALDGPLKCSGLPVQRYSAESLQQQLGDAFELLGHEYETHETPFGTQQKFIYCYFKIKEDR